MELGLEHDSYQAPQCSSHCLFLSVCLFLPPLTVDWPNLLKFQELWLGAQWVGALSRYSKVVGWIPGQRNVQETTNEYISNCNSKSMSLSLELTNNKKNLITNKKV